MNKANNSMTFSDEQAMILESARDFCRDKSPIPAVRALLKSDTGYDATVWQEMIDLGWLGIAIAEEFGGSGMGIGSVVPLAECMGRSLLSTPFFSTTLAAQALSRAGDAAQKDAWLPQLAQGTVATLALLEGEDWGDESIACQANADGDHVTLQGSKWFVTDALVAELFVVLVVSSGAPALALVTRDQLDDAAIQPHLLIDETKRAAKVDFSGVVIDNGALLSGEHIASTLRDLKLIGALLAAAEATGASAACLDTVVEYLKTRKQFGKLIGSYQALKHPTVDILCAMYSARSHIYHAA
jgi:acyl-CoA dehydrogenase